jgi:DNA-binding transcriptional ArsR family regulator
MAVKDIDLSSARAIRSPVRTQILEILLAQAPLSVADIAARMGRPPAALYHHIKTLAAAGLLRDAGTAGQGRETERLYAPVARGFRVRTEKLTKPGREDFAGLGAAHARYALRRYVRAVETADAVLSGPGRNALVRHLSLRLSSQGLKELNQDLEALIIKWAAAPSNEDAAPLSVAIVMGPHKA